MTSQVNMLINVQLANGIYWRIRKSDPDRYYFRNIKFWSLVNPLLYPFLLPTLEKRIFRAVGMYKSSALIETSTLVFASPHNTIDESIEDLLQTRLSDRLESISQFLERLRLASNQASISRNSIGISVAEHVHDRFPTILFPRITRKKGAFATRIALETAINWSDLKSADNQTASPTEQTYNATLLDAIQAYNSGDYRTAILYSAITIEITSRIILDEKYKELIKSEANNQTLRIVNIPQGGGKTIRKDPVFEFMMEGDHFLKLIHQIPLYLIGRSLLFEKESLYQKAHKLYSTRNKIVHQGSVTPSEKTLPINRKGALEAIECAIAIMEWFGLQPRHRSLQDKYITLHEITISRD